MSKTSPRVSPVPPHPVSTAVSLACPLLLLAGYFFLASSFGGRWFDRHSLGSYGSGLMSFAALMLTIAAVIILGVGMGVRAWRRREQPRWLAGIALSLNILILVLAASTLM